MSSAPWSLWVCSLLTASRGRPVSFFPVECTTEYFTNLIYIYHDYIERSGSKEGDAFAVVTVILSYIVLASSVLLLFTMALCFAIFVVCRGAAIERRAAEKSLRAQKENAVLHLAWEIMDDYRLQRTFNAWRDMPPK